MAVCVLWPVKIEVFPGWVPWLAAVLLAGDCCHLVWFVKVVVVIPFDFEPSFVFQRVRGLSGARKLPRFPFWYRASLGCRSIGGGVFERKLVRFVA